MGSIPTPCCGWYPFPLPVAAGSGSVSMATDSGYSHPGQTHSGLPQCDSRPVISAEPAHHNRVESPPRNSEADIRDVGNSSSGHVCHSPQHASSPVYVSSSRAASTGDRRSVTRLAGEVDVHVSTFSPDQQSHSEAQYHPGGRSDTHSPLVAITAVVSTLTTSLCGPPIILSVLLLQQGYVSRLAAVPRRPSTNKMYDDRWLRFAHWATGKGFDPLGSIAAQIAAFLYDLYDFFRHDYVYGITSMA